MKAELPSPTSYNNPTPNLSSKQTIDVKKKSTVVTDLLRNDSCETILDVGDSCDNKSVSSTEYENSWDFIAVKSKNNEYQNTWDWQNEKFR